MTVSQKAALSLLVSVLLFAVFTVLAFTGLFNLIETSFYNPSITSSLNRELNRNAVAIDSILNSWQAKFSAALSEPSVRRSFLSNQTAEDIFERSRIFGTLQESLGGFQWARFIDSGGIRLNYSTYPSDILSQDRNFTAYRNYPGLTGSLPYESIASHDGENGKIIFDEDGERVLVSLPFYDYYEVFRGTALFSISIRGLSEQLINEGLIKAGDDVTVLADPRGVLIGRPVSAGKSFFPQVASVWNSGILSLAAIDSADSSGTLNSLVLLSAQTPQGIFVGRLVNENVFSFPMPMKIILLISFFLTIYLIIFLLLNLRQDSVTVVQNRLRQLQISLIEQYYERKSVMDWGRWSRELEQRRDEIRAELKKGIRDNRKTKDGGNDIDQLIDKSWDELLAVIGGRRDSGIDEEKLQAIVNRILAAPVSAEQLTAPVNKAPVNTAAVRPVVLPEKSGPANPEPADLEPAELEPAELEPADLEPAELEPADAELTEAVDAVEELEPADLEPAELEPAELEPVDSEPAELEPADLEPAELEPADAELAEAVDTVEELEPAELEPAELELVDAEPAELEPAEAAAEIQVSADSGFSELAGSQTAAEQTAEPELLEEIGEFEDLEELDLAEEVGELEELDSAETESIELESGEVAGELEELSPDETGAMPAAQSEVNLDELARQIEYSDVIPADDEDADVIFSGDFEIASPFKTMFNEIHEPEWTDSGSPEIKPVNEPNEDLPELAPAEEEEKKNLTDPADSDAADYSGLEALPIKTGPAIIYRPFQAVDLNPQILQAQDDEVLEELQAQENTEENVINEKDGVPYINKVTVDSESADLNQDFKKLVDSILD
ncbi:MAG: hypothetical protein FWD78_03480 [Treponema sp.]|nr:hypothetical protein [Treponema sp.]